MAGAGTAAMTGLPGAMIREGTRARAARAEPVAAVDPAVDPVRLIVALRKGVVRVDPVRVPARASARAVLVVISKVGTGVALPSRLLPRGCRSMSR